MGGAETGSAAPDIGAEARGAGAAAGAAKPDEPVAPVSTAATTAHTGSAAKLYRAGAGPRRGRNLGRGKRVEAGRPVAVMAPPSADVEAIRRVAGPAVRNATKSRLWRSCCGRRSGGAQWSAGGVGRVLEFSEQRFVR